MSLIHALSLVLGPGWIDDVAIALDDAQEREEFGIDRFFSFRGLGHLVLFKESGHTFRVAAVVPVIEDGSAGNVRRPEVAGLRFAAAGLEVSDGGFVDLAVKRAPMFVLDFSVNDGEPVGGEQRPVAEGFAVNVHSHAGEHFGLPVVGEVADESIVDHFGDEAGGGDATVLQGRWQRIDEGFGGGVVLEDEFATHKLDAKELGGLEAELFAHFFADAAEVVRIEQDFGRIELLADDGKVLGDTWGAGLFGGFFVSGDFSRWCWVCGDGGVGFFCEVASEHEFELGGGPSFSLDLPKMRRQRASMVCLRTMISAAWRAMTSSRWAIWSSSFLISSPLITINVVAKHMPT